MVSALALEHFEKAPKYFISSAADSAPYYGQFLTVRQFREEHPEVPVYLMIDDAAYSCLQMRDTALIVSEINTHDYRDLFSRWMGRLAPTTYGKANYIFATIIPIMQSPHCIQEWLDHYDSTAEVKVFTSKKIFWLNEVLNKSQLCSLGFSPTQGDKSLAYLNHKHPDGVSVPYSFFELWTYNHSCPEEYPSWPESEYYYLKHCGLGKKIF